jgi:anthranilate phosphoribosyltransferase
VEESAADPLRQLDTSVSTALGALIDRRDLDEPQMRRLIEGILFGTWEEPETAALLVALRMKGETANELAVAATVLREHMTPLDTGGRNVLDTCGTGGDGAGTFNISTATAFVAAGAGVPVVKHGNRAVSGHSGSADVLTALGIALSQNRAWVKQCLESAGLAFCLAPHFHPVLKRLGPIRRRLGVSTLFNYLGPLANPAGAVYQLIGVGRSDLLDPLAHALSKLGTRRAFLVCGVDGLDEISLSGPTLVREVTMNTSRILNEVRTLQWVPADFGLASCALADISVAGPQESAGLIEAVLNGQEGPARRMVIANSAAALLAAERAGSLAEGVDQAVESLRSGRARQVLERLRALSQQVRD